MLPLQGLAPLNSPPWLSWVTATMSVQGHSSPCGGAGGRPGRSVAGLSGSGLGGLGQGQGANHVRQKGVRVSEPPLFSGLGLDKATCDGW